MLAPKASVQYVPHPIDPLRFIFKGVLLSGSDPADTYTWDFGDSTTGNTQEYDKTYLAPGVYLVTLTVTNIAGSNTYLMYITVFTDTGGIIPIITQVSYKIPQEALNPGQINYLTKKWQLYLQPQVNPIAIEDGDVYVEASWPPLYNILIAQLVVWDYIVDNAGKLAIINFNGPTGSSTDVESNGGIKYIETGPSRAEFFEDSSKNLRFQSLFITSIFNKATGMMESYKETICTLSARLRVTIPICKALPNRNMLFQKEGRTYKDPLIILNKWF